VTAVLMDFSANRNPNRSRQEYVEVLKKDICTYYSYNKFFMKTLLDVFPVNELVEFFEALEVQRPLTIRTNSLKTRRRDLAQALINRGPNNDLPVSTGNMLPIKLAPQENEKILDMCAAPDGKNSHIAVIMKNTGVLFANDLDKDRIPAVIGDFHRFGVVKSIATNLN
jgi:ribosomal RNA methyltransferase Nop2